MDTMHYKPIDSKPYKPIIHGHHPSCVPHATHRFDGRTDGLHQFSGGEDRCAHGWIEHQGDTRTEMWLTKYTTCPKWESMAVD